MATKESTGLPWRLNPKRLVTVEVVIFLYITGVILEIPVIQQYLYERAKEELKANETYPNNTVCNPSYDNSSEHRIDDKVQKKASYNILAVNMALTLPAVFTACIFGVWSDKRGRKGPMVIASVGCVADAVIILIGMYLQLPIYVFMIASGMAGLGGYYPTMVLAILAYVADTTSPQSRALRLGILEAIAFISGTVGQFSSGVWIKNYGFESVYWAILIVHSLNLMYIGFFLPESFPKELKQDTAICSCDSVKAICMVYAKKRNGRWILITLVICTVLVFLSTFVIQTLLVLFGKRAPLCWKSSTIGYFFGTLLFSKAIGAVVGIKLCSCFGFSNYSATQIGIFFLIANLIMIGFARTTLEMFIATAIAFFSGIPQPCIRAEMSKMVKKEEQGALFAILASLESLCNFSSQLIFNPLYTWTVTEVKGEYSAGITFFLSAGLLLVPMILIGIIQCSKTNKHTEYPPLLAEENPVS